MNSTSSFVRTGSALGLLLVAGLALSTEANAAMVKDSHGNVGYDTAAECDAAIQAGTAVFYKSFTHKPPLLRKGEASVKVMQLSDVTIPSGFASQRNYTGTRYTRGACDVGAPHAANRDGVAKALQGKYIPYSPDMLVNVYHDKAGTPVRVMMKQCDNWFGDKFPRPSAAAAAVAQRPAAAPTPAAVAPTTPAPVVATPVTPAPVAPAPAPLAGAKAAAASAWGQLSSPTVLGVAGGVVLGAILLSNHNDDAGTTGSTGTSGTSGTSGTR